MCGFSSIFHISTGLYEMAVRSMEICSHHCIIAYFMTTYALHVAIWYVALQWGHFLDEFVSVYHHALEL